MTPRPFLLDFPDYTARRGPETLARERALMRYLGDDYRLRPGVTWADVAADLGGTPQRWATELGLVHRSAYRYLTDAAFRSAARKRSRSDLSGRLAGVRVLMDAGAVSLDDLATAAELAQLEADGASVAQVTAAREARGPRVRPKPGAVAERAAALGAAGEPERAAAVRAANPEPTAAPPAPVQPDAVARVRGLVVDVLESWAVAESALRDVLERVGRLEDTRASLLGEVRSLEDLVAELEGERREVAASVTGGTVLPVAPTLDPGETGRPATFDYSKHFRKRFAGLRPHEQRQVVKTLERIQYKPATKLEGGGAPFNVPAGTLATRAALKHRLLWRRDGDTLRVYDVVPKNEY